MTRCFLAIVFLSAGLGFSRSVAAQEKIEKFRFVHLEFSGTQAAPFIAKRAKVFEKHGLDVEIIRIGGSSRVVQAMVAGEIKMAHVGASTVVEANLSGADIVIIASTVNVPTFRMMAAPHVKRPAELKGKKIGISRFGGATEQLTRVLLEKWGIDSSKEVTLLQMGGVQETAAGLLAKVVDAGLLSSPQHLRVSDAGFHQLADLADLGIPYMSGSIATTKAFIRNQPDLVRRFTRGLLEGIKIYKTDREFSIRALEQFTRNTDPRILAALWDENGNKVIQKVPLPSAEGLQFVMDEVAMRKPEAKRLRPADLIDARFIKELEESGFVKALYGEK
jgi:ABC-type nitrate/sulfonate/bicarbonate transport system substrate-binding protein